MKDQSRVVDTTNAILMNSRTEGPVEFSVDGVSQAVNHTWFRGDNCNFGPVKENLVDADSVLKHVLPGWAPHAPMIGRSDSVVAFGSCFAANITAHLAKRNFNVLTAKEGDNAEAYVVRFGEGMVNSFVIRQQFEWAFENKAPAGELWHGYDAVAFGYDEDVRAQTEKIFRSADVFIITLGLSEVWYDERTGGVFWRAVPKSAYDPSRHKFRVSTVAENKENITAIYQLIRRHRPEAKVIFTLSPVPLIATFRDVSCLTANSVSKAVLRAAFDEVYREINEPQSLFYWPSYEIVTDVFQDPWARDRRHVIPEVLAFIMSLFETVWCKDTTPEISIEARWVVALLSSGDLPKRLLGMIRTGAREKLEVELTKLEKRQPKEAAMIRRAAQELMATSHATQQPARPAAAAE